MMNRIQVKMILSMLIMFNSMYGATTSTLPLFHPQTIKRFISNRCHNSYTPSSAIWSWEGRLVDPSNGKIIANVEGIELIRTLCEIERPASSSPDTEEKTNNLWRLARGLRRLHDLKVKTMLTQDKDWDYAGTVLCRKLFCYSPAKDGQEEEDNVGYTNGNNKRSLLLKQFKHHPNSPIKNIKMEEAVALYDTATTFISRNDGKNLEIVTEWPDGRWIQSQASGGVVLGMNHDYSSSLNTNRGSKYFNKSSKRGDNKFPFAYTTYVKRSGKGEIPSLPEIKQSIPTSTVTNTTKNTIIPRSKFIQFGKDEDSENRRYGARESYAYIMGGESESKRSNRYVKAIQETITNVCEKIGIWDFDFQQNGGSNSDGCTVQYTRYGEAPPWYAPGKMCTLELVGRRVNSVTDAPPLAATLAATCVPGFMSVHTPIPFNVDSTVKKRKGEVDQSILRQQLIEDNNAVNAIKWFRGYDKSLPLKLLPENGISEEQDLSQQLADKALHLIHRICSAITFQAATEN